ncbi:BH3226 [Halalkalibacterium halodurans C-125]|uniref:BH3226 protein n=1 Tax=Halalkalibacterium halodurans (strain ATCC BAA-125 / DSM 18197 / FERM 7344 / JCM 9153 / C-125) TaxID=272558 RepID=Q9K7Y1_HALH5|nr:BH3226 [Halalkalibacterium halodurans C-125]
MDSESHDQGNMFISIGATVTIAAFSMMADK